MTLVVLGDLMVDVVARIADPLAHASDTPARISVQGGGSAANTAAWAASIGTDVAHARAELGLGAIIVANPIDEPLDQDLHDRVLESGLAAAAEQGVRGKDITPFLLDYFHRETDGASLEANVRLVLRNATLAAQIACATA